MERIGNGWTVRGNLELAGKKSAFLTLEFIIAVSLLAFDFTLDVCLLAFLPGVGRFLLTFVWKYVIIRPC